MIVCRNATPNDINEFKKMFNNFWTLDSDERSMVVKDGVRYECENEEQFKKFYDELTDYEDLILVQADDSDEIVGYAICKAYEEDKEHHIPRRGELDEIFIKPEHRNNGYARACIEHICKILREIDMQEIFVASMTKETDDFWLKMKFSPQIDKNTGQYSAAYVLNLKPSEESTETT